jgi:hypothetical protein
LTRKKGKPGFGLRTREGELGISVKIFGFAASHHLHFFALSHSWNTGYKHGASNTTASERRQRQTVRGAAATRCKRWDQGTLAPYWRSSASRATGKEQQVASLIVLLVLACEPEKKMALALTWSRQAAARTASGGGELVLVDEHELGEARPPESTTSGQSRSSRGASKGTKHVGSGVLRPAEEGEGARRCRACRRGAMRADVCKMETGRKRTRSSGRQRTTSG